MNDHKEVQLMIPPTAVSATIRVKVSPPSGAILIYGAPDYKIPIRFGGPHSTGRISTSSPSIKVELIDGATSWEIETLGWEDNVNATR